MTSYFSPLVDFVHAHSQYIHIVIFLLALSEAIPVVGTVVPGSTLIIGISALATGANANPWTLLVVATTGAIIGDGLSFRLGQRYHREILSSWPLNQYPQFIARSEIFVTQYGATSDGRVRLYTINGADWSKRYPLIMEAARRIDGSERGGSRLRADVARR